MSVETRNCGCGNNMNGNTLENNMGVNQNMCNCNNMMDQSDVLAETEMNMNNCECEKLRETREDMAKKIKCLDFAIIELALYLDTHPDDQKALCLHRKYTKECKELKDKYQKVYGPLTICYPCNKWRWLEEPWPWERGNF